MRYRCVSTFAVAVVAIWCLSTMSGNAQACPFCRPLKTTFYEDINASDITVLAELVHRPDVSDVSRAELPSADLIKSYEATFRVKKVYKGDQHIQVGKTLTAIYTGTEQPGTLFLVRGVDPAALQWAPPLALSERAQAYVENILKLPKDPAERLRFFEDYLDDPEETLRADAFDEFARADYSAMKAAKDSFDHDRIIGWIKNPNTPSHMRPLCFSMLGICGRPEDAKMLEDLLRSGDRDQLAALTSLASCYLTLTGVEGLPLIEDLFLRGGVMWDPEYVHTYGAIMALRFLGEQGGVIDRDRLLQSLRIILKRPQLADLVIQDLARWEDWAAMPQLVELFKTANEESHWVRVPIINYLRACPLPEAKNHIDELAQIDPDAVKRAASLFPFPAAAGAVRGNPPPAAAKEDSTTGSPDAPASGDSPPAAAKEAPATGERATGDPADGKRESSTQTDEKSNLESPQPSVTAAKAEPITPPAAFQNAERNVSLIAGIIVISVVGTVALLGLMWLILRRPHERISSQHR